MHKRVPRLGIAKVIQKQPLGPHRQSDGPHPRKTGGEQVQLEKAPADVADEKAQHPQHQGVEPQQAGEAEITEKPGPYAEKQRGQVLLEQGQGDGRRKQQHRPHPPNGRQQAGNLLEHEQHQEL